MDPGKQETSSNRIPVRVAHICGGVHESPFQQEVENQVIRDHRAIRLSPGGTRDKGHVEARMWGPSAGWLGCLVTTGSRGHVTPASKNQERKTRRGEQEPHGRWEEPFPDVVLVPGNSTVSVQPRQTPSVPRSPQGCCDRGLQTHGQKQHKGVFSQFWSPEVRNQDVSRWSPPEVLRHLSQLLEPPSVSQSAEAPLPALPPSSRHLFICVFSPFLPLQGLPWWSSG